MSQRFIAPSPKDGEIREWEAIVELGSADPTSFTATGPVGESYEPGDEGYKELLAEYKKYYSET